MHLLFDNKLVIKWQIKEKTSVFYHVSASYLRTVTSFVTLYNFRFEISKFVKRVTAF